MWRADESAEVKAKESFPEVGRNAPCPCGSGKVLKDCCLTKRNVTTPPGEKTGYMNPRCYARVLADCGRQLSREHYISESILVLMNAKQIVAMGFPWLGPGELRRVSPESLTAKVMCTRHNSALSGLDSTDLLLFNYLVGESRENYQNVLLINGEEIERWMLKTLCGVVASGNVVHDSAQIRGWEPPRQWLEVLFGSERIPPGCGLHYIIGKWRASSNRLEMNTVMNATTGDIVAMMFALAGFPFLFAMESQVYRDGPTPSGFELRHHPKVLQVRTSKGVREVHFGWPEGSFIITEVVKETT